MAFSKDNIPWNKGLKGVIFHSEQTKKQMSENRKGKVLSIDTRRKIGLKHKGKKLSEETKRKLSISHKGHIPWSKGRRFSDEIRKHISESHKNNKSALGHKLSDEVKQRLREINIGKKLSEETKKKISESLKGCKGPSWKGGVTPESAMRTHSREWKTIRAKVYKRDNWICQVCFKKCHAKGEIQCHHIVPYRVTQDNSEANLITLCNVCHIRVERAYYEKLVQF